ncbi:MAG TPA: PKD domain-containing protein [Candidatus Saccharimonadales bacterium]|nr:PKD domain-containing protein [Candidatus Saccharimonadales bacterium]
MFLWLKLSHHKHTARQISHEYTSYVSLALLLVVVGLALVGSTIASASPGPQSGSVALNGVMPEPPPTKAATIDAPGSSQHFGSTPVTVSGTCPANTLVEIYKNDIFAGSTPCDSNGRYEVKVDLLGGQDILIARVYDVLNQAGPDSNAVTVFYDALPPQASSLAPLNFGSSQLVLSTDAVYRGLFPGHPLSMPLNVLGGTPPYAINIQWGDSTNSVVPRSDNLTFTVQHTYQRPGTYQITIQASDAQGRVAFLTIAAIVNGQPAVIPTANTTKTSTNKLLMLWPLYTASVAVVVSFWLGERREKHILGGSGPLYYPQA